MTRTVIAPAGARATVGGGGGAIVSEADAWGTKGIFDGNSFTTITRSNITLKASAMTLTTATTLNLHATTAVDVLAGTTAKVRAAGVEVRFDGATVVKAGSNLDLVRAVTRA